MLNMRQRIPYVFQPWQIIDSLFSPVAYHAIMTKTDDAAEGVLRYVEDVVNRLRNMRGRIRLFGTARRTPFSVPEMGPGGPLEDIAPRWMEIFDDVIEVGK